MKTAVHRRSRRHAGARSRDRRRRLGLVRMIGRTAVGASSASPFVQVTKARSAKVQFARKVLCKVDGADHKEVKKPAIEIEPAAVDMCVPAGSA